MHSNYVDELQKPWDRLLLLVVFSTDSFIHDSSGDSPFTLLHGRHCTLALDIALPATQEGFVQDVKKQMKDVHASANAMIEAKQKFIYARDNHPDVGYDIGNFVLVFNASDKKGKAMKLLSLYYGPYKVIHQVTHVDYEVETRVNAGSQHFSRMKEKRSDSTIERTLYGQRRP